MKGKSEDLVEGDHVDEILHHAMVMDGHNKTLIRKMHKKYFEEDFQAKEIDGKIAMLSKPYRTADMTLDFIEILNTNCLETPEDIENFDSFIICCLIFWYLDKNENSPFKCDCFCPYYVSRGVCKHVLQHAIRKN